MVDIVADGVQLILRRRLVDHYNPVLYMMIASNQNHEDAPFPKRHQLDTIQNLARGRQSGGDSYLEGQLRKNTRRTLYPALDGIFHAKLDTHPLGIGTRDGPCRQR